MYGILEGAQETWTMAGIGTRFTIERVMIGNYLPKVVRACALLDPLQAFGFDCSTAALQHRSTILPLTSNLQPLPSSLNRSTAALQDCNTIFLTAAQQHCNTAAPSCPLH
jgi:hypothetical protein